MTSAWASIYSFTSKFFYVMGKALSGDVSCTGTDLVFSFVTNCAFLEEIGSTPEGKNLHM